MPESSHANPICLDFDQSDKDEEGVIEHERNQILYVEVVPDTDDGGDDFVGGIGKKVNDDKNGGVAVKPKKRRIKMASPTKIKCHGIGRKDVARRNKYNPSLNRYMLKPKEKSGNDFEISTIHCSGWRKYNVDRTETELEVEIDVERDSVNVNPPEAEIDVHSKKSNPKGIRTEN